MIEKKHKKEPDYYIGVGLCFGVAFGALYDNIGLGISLGLVFGVAWQQNAKKKYLKSRNFLQKTINFLFIIHFATKVLHTIGHH
jgi:hypothetical protein